MKQFLFSYLFFFIALPSFGTHILGSQLHSEYIRTLPNGDREYRFVLILERSCAPGNIPLIPEVEIGIYNALDSSRFKALKMPIILKTRIEDCHVLTCIEQARYEAVTSLPTNNSGYHATFEMCCRTECANLRNNQNGVPDLGTMNYCFIPASPGINNNSAELLIGRQIFCKPDIRDTFFFSVYDKDNDSVTIDITTPNTGASLSNNFPGSALVFNGLEPISASNYDLGYAPGKPLGASSTFEIEPGKYQLDIQCSREDVYSVAYLIREYRNGQLISSSISEGLVFITSDITSGSHIELRGSGTLQPQVNLVWSVSCPENVKKQYLYKSINNTSGFFVIDSFNTSKNQYTDNDVMLGQTYFYRVTSVDHLSQDVISNTAYFHLWSTGIDPVSKTSAQLLIFPQPVSGVCQIELNEGSIQAYDLTDHTGRVIFTGTAENVNSSRLALDCNGLQSGVYFVRIFSNTGSTITCKILKL